MELTSWASAIGAVAGGLLTASIGFAAVLYANRRHGRWESIKNDLETAELLADSDPMKRWLRTYADVRLRAYARSETEPRRDPFFRVLAAATALLSLLLYAPIAENWQYWDSSASAKVLIIATTIVIAVAAIAVPIFGYFAFKKTIYALRGVRHGLLDGSDEEVVALHNDRALRTKRD